MLHRVITFYKYVVIEEPDKLKNSLKGFCIRHDILGRILLSEEGINGAVCGKADKIEALKQHLKNNSLFSDITFRQHECHEQAYHKLVVRVRKEIVHFGERVDLSKKGEYVTPDELKALLDSKEDLVIIDARNEYEAKVGKFADAVVLPIENFRDLPKQISKLNDFKKKKIVMYCTGGIRCEKASAFLKQEGFSDVLHLKGGIIDYLDKYPKDHFKGNCFVFDDRLVADTGGEPIGECLICKTPSWKFINCHNLDCDRLFICCETCQKKMEKCCSERCMGSPRQRIEKKKLKEIGHVMNYYATPRIAHVMLKRQVSLGLKLYFSGKTTKEFPHVISEMRDSEGKLILHAESGTEITFPVANIVRKNDKLLIEV